MHERRVVAPLAPQALPNFGLCHTSIASSDAHLLPPGHPHELLVLLDLPDVRLQPGHLAKPPPDPARQHSLGPRDLNLRVAARTHDRPAPHHGAKRVLAKRRAEKHALTRATDNQQPPTRKKNQQHHEQQQHTSGLSTGLSTGLYNNDQSRQQHQHVFRAELHL